MPRWPWQRWRSVVRSWLLALQHVSRTHFYGRRGKPVSRLQRRRTCHHAHARCRHASKQRLATHGSRIAGCGYADGDVATPARTSALVSRRQAAYPSQALGTRLRSLRSGRGRLCRASSLLCSCLADAISARPEHPCGVHSAIREHGHGTIACRTCRMALAAAGSPCEASIKIRTLGPMASCTGAAAPLGPARNGGRCARLLRRRCAQCTTVI